MKKKILFLVHSNGDLDTYLPLMSELKRSEVYEPVALYIRPKEVMEIGAVLEWILRDEKIDTYTLKDIYGRMPVRKALLRVFGRCFTGSGTVPIRDLVKSFSVRKLALKSVYIALDRLYNRYPGYFFPAAELSTFVKENAPSMVIIDIQKIRKRPPYEDLREYVASSVITAAKNTGVPLFMVPHGAPTAPEEGAPGRVSSYFKDGDRCAVPVKEARPAENKDLFYPDILSANIEDEKIRFTAHVNDRTEVVALGTLRYDLSWVWKIQGVSRKLHGGKLAKKRFAVLYIISRFNYDDEVNMTVTRDVLSLLDVSPDIEIWVKNHPRYPWYFSGKDVPADGDKRSRVRVFGNGTETAALLMECDAVVSPISSTMYHAILTGKPVIYYYWWKDYMKYDIKTVFDESDCVFKAADAAELRERMRQIIGGMRPDIFEINSFYKRWVSVGPGGEGRISSRYVDAINGFLARRSRQK